MEHDPKKQKVIDEGNFERIPALTRNIKWKWNARLDKERMLTQQLEEADAHGYKWEGLKAARKGFQPKRTKFETHTEILSKNRTFHLKLPNTLKPSSGHLRPTTQ